MAANWKELIVNLACGGVMAKALDGHNLFNTFVAPLLVLLPCWFLFVSADFGVNNVNNQAKSVLGPSKLKVFVVMHSHLDVGWVWSMPEVKTDNSP